MEVMQFETELKTSMGQKHFPQLLQDCATQKPKEVICDTMFFVPIPEALNSSNGFISYTEEWDAMITRALNAATTLQQVTPLVAEAHNPPRFKLLSISCIAVTISPTKHLHSAITEPFE